MNWFEFHNLGYPKAIGPYATSLLMYLDFKQGRKKYCWPKVKTMAEYMGWNVKTVKKCLSVLTQQGLLTDTERAFDPKTKRFKYTKRHVVKSIEKSPRNDIPPYIPRGKKVSQGPFVPSPRDRLVGRGSRLKKRGKTSLKSKVFSSSKEKSQGPLGGPENSNHLTLINRTLITENDKSSSDHPVFLDIEDKEKEKKGASRMEPVTKNRGEPKTTFKEKERDGLSAGSKPPRKKPLPSLEEIKQLLDVWGPDKLKDYLIKHNYDPVGVNEVIEKATQEVKPSH